MIVHISAPIRVWKDKHIQYEQAVTILFMAHLYNIDAQIKLDQIERETRDIHKDEKPVLRVLPAKQHRLRRGKLPAEVVPTFSLHILS